MGMGEYGAKGMISDHCRSTPNYDHDSSLGEVASVVIIVIDSAAVIFFSLLLEELYVAVVCRSCT